MKIYDLRDKSGELFAVEVNSLITRRAACRIARRIPGVRMLERARDRCGRVDGVFCPFEVGGVAFHIWEPFNDNSRYWIGPDPMQQTPYLAVVRETFAQANPWAAFFALNQKGELS